MGLQTLGTLDILSNHQVLNLKKKFRSAIDNLAQDSPKQ